MFWFQVKKKTKEIKQKTKSKILKCLQANQKKKKINRKGLPFLFLFHFLFEEVSFSKH